MLLLSNPYAQLLRLDRPVGFWLLLWPTLSALWIANQGTPPPALLLLFTLGVFITRMAGCVINDILDHRFDAKVQRTCQRPLATGALSLQQAWFTFGILSTGALFLALFLPTASWGLLPWIAALAMLYPLMKRIMPCPQLILGLCWNGGILLAFVASGQALSKVAWILYGVGVLWTLAYDTLYAMADATDDARLGLHSSARWFGRHSLRFVLFFNMLALAGVAWVGFLLQGSFDYFLFVFLMGLCVLRLHKLSKKEAFRAFKGSHWILFIFFIGTLYHLSHPC